MPLDLQEPEYSVVGDQNGFGLEADQVGMSPPPTGLNLEQPGSSGGFALDPDEVANIHSRAAVNGVSSASPMATQMAMRQEFMKDKTGWQKFAYGLNALGTGINGQESLLDRDIKHGMDAKRLDMEKKQQELTAFKATYGMFDESFKVLKKVPIDKRADAIQQLAGRMDSVSPGSGKAFTAYANFNDSDIEQSALQMFGDPEISKALLKMTGGDEDKFYKLVTSPETVKMLTGQVDQKRLPGIVQKMSAIRGIPEDQIPEDLLPKIKRDKEGNIMLDTSLLRTVNDRLPEKLRLNEGDFQTIQRNPDEFVSAGFVSPKNSSEVQKKELTKDEWGEPYNLDGQTVQKNQAGEIRQVTRAPGGNTNVKVDTQGNQVFTQEHQLRQDYDKQSAKFADMKAYFLPVARKVEAKKPLGPAESLQLAYAYAHSLDPSSDRITEGDFGRLEKLGSIPQRVGVAIKSVLQGYNLPPDIAQEMYSVTSKQFGELNKKQRGTEDQYNRMATEYPGLSPERVVRKHSIDDKASPKPPAAAEGKRPVAQIESDAKANGWSDLETERVIRDMHGEDEVRKWRTRASEERLKNVKGGRRGH